MSDGFYPTPHQIEMQPVKLLSSPLQICVRRLEIRRPSKAPARQLCDILEKDRLEGVSTRRSCTYPASHVLTPAAIELPPALPPNCARRHPRSNRTPRSRCSNPKSALRESFLQPPLKFLSDGFCPTPNSSQPPLMYSHREYPNPGEADQEAAEVTFPPPQYTF